MRGQWRADSALTFPEMVPRFLFGVVFVVGQGSMGTMDFGEGECICPCDSRRDGRCPGGAADLDDDHCYKPVCPPGTYRCCSTCAMSTCAGKIEMVKSKRDLMECIPCMIGDYCPGCDIRVACPEGTVNPEPRKSEMQDCQPCDFTEEANYERSACCPAGEESCTMRNPVKTCTKTDGADKGATGGTAAPAGTGSGAGSGSDCGEDSAPVAALLAVIALGVF